uniref:Uncharacterized protein n=1 Tax=Physcomitrium patens TaxID=3218 RepID=A0A2K1IUZ6_PHYPA|nr:hypothetical protein PHYPA_025031 [Physcomitrium patens]
MGYNSTAVEQIRENKPDQVQEHLIRLMRSKIRDGQHQIQGGNYSCVSVLFALRLLTMGFTVIIQQHDRRFVPARIEVFLYFCPLKERNGLQLLISSFEICVSFLLLGTSWSHIAVSLQVLVEIRVS